MLHQSHRAHRQTALCVGAATRSAAGCMVALSLLISIGCAPADPGSTSTNGGSKRLTLERLYSLPTLIGTAPSGFAWSPNSARFAFLWNDEGKPHRDVWVAEVGGSELSPTRWSDLQRTTSPASTDKLAETQYHDAVAQETRDRDPGARAVLWHPDGERVIVAVGSEWRTVAPGAESQKFLENARQLAFDSTGKQLAFLRDGDLWTASADGSGARRLTRLAKEATRVASFRWSPNGNQIAVFESDRSQVTVRGVPDYLTEETTLHQIRRAYPGEEPERQRLGVIDASGGAISWIDLAKPAPAMVLSYRWSPDGAHLAIDTSDLYAKDRQIFVASTSPPGAPSRMVARDADPMNETFYYWRIEWSTDSNTLYFLSDRATDFHVWAVSKTGGEARALTSGNWAVAEIFPIDAGVLAVANRGNAEERQLLRVTSPDADGAPPQIEPVSSRSGTHAPVVSPDGRWAAVAHSADDSPPELLLTEIATATEQQVTQSPVEEFTNYTWASPTYVEFESHVDGSTLHGRLTLPKDFDSSKRYPAILGSVYTDSVRNQWGGRTAHPTWGLDQYLLQEGYVLLNVDMRGSWGRGSEHRRGIRLDYGGIDIDDLESGVRFLGSLGYVDLDRVGIWGSSYGGLMTAMSLFRKPDLYAAGVAGAPATNVGHALMGQMAVMMRPEDQPAEYADSSPYLHGHGLKAPLMIIHGMRDRVVLYKDSVILTQRLIQMDKDVELVTLPNAGHGWDNEGLAQTRYAFRKLVQHFELHLKPGL